MWLTNRNFNFAIWSECAPIAACPNTHSSSHFYFEAYIFMQTYKKNNKNIRTHKINAQNYPAGHTHRSIAGTNHIFTKGLPRRKRFPPDSININNNNNRKKVWILYVIHTCKMNTMKMGSSLYSLLQHNHAQFYTHASKSFDSQRR